MHLLLEHLQCWWDSRRQPFPLIVAKWHVKCCEHGGHFIQLDIYVAHSLLSGSGTPCTRALVGCTPSHHRGISSNYQICHWLHYRPAIDLSCLVNLPLNVSHGFLIYSCWEVVAPPALLQCFVLEPLQGMVVERGWCDCWNWRWKESD